MYRYKMTPKDIADVELIRIAISDMHYSSGKISYNLKKIAEELLSDLASNAQEVHVNETDFWDSSKSYEDRVSKGSHILNVPK